MTVYRRSRAKSWSVLVELRRDAVGNRRRVYEGGFRTKREALAAELSIKSELARGTWVDQSSLTVGEHVLRWLDQHSHNIKPTTHQSYAANVTNHIIPHLGHIKLQELTVAQLNEFYSTLLTNGRIKTGSDKGGSLSPTTVRYIAIILGKSLQDALESGQVVRNVAVAARKPRISQETKNEVRTWSASEVAQFLDSTSVDRLHPLWVLYATTGLRRGEGLGLRWEDVDLQGGHASIRQNLVVVRGGLKFGTPKNNRGRQISLANQTAKALSTWRAVQLTEKLALGVTWDNSSGNVFTREDGSPLHPDRVTSEFRRSQKRTELPKITLHQLRHTWATLALQAGIQPKIVSENLGHSSIQITMDTYSHVLPTMTTDAVARVADAIYRQD